MKVALFVLSLCPIFAAGRRVQYSERMGAVSPQKEWEQYLASMANKDYKEFDWKVACKRLHQQPSSYGMSAGAGKINFLIECNANHIKVVCSIHGRTLKKCTSAYHPAPTAADTPPPPHYVKKAVVSHCAGSKDRMTPEEAQEILDIQNKMRCAVGSEPMEWDADLQCQAQQTQDEIGAFKHSHSYDLPIEAGENLATGTGVDNAAWMWFLEYMETLDYVHHMHETGHFTAMTWKSVEKVGCGIQRTGFEGGVIRCQYSAGHGAAPNTMNPKAFDLNVPKFHGEPSHLTTCGLPIADAKSHAEMEEKWGILHPKGEMAHNLGVPEM